MEWFIIVVLVLAVIALFVVNFVTSGSEEYLKQELKKARQDSNQKDEELYKAKRDARSFEMRYDSLLRESQVAIEKERRKNEALNTKAAAPKKTVAPIKVNDKRGRSNSNDGSHATIFTHPSVYTESDDDSRRGSGGYSGGGGAGRSWDSGNDYSSSSSSSDSDSSSSSSSYDSGSSSGGGSFD